MSMNCEAYRTAHPAGGPEARAHEAACPECRAFARTWELLGAYEELPAPPGYFRRLKRRLASPILRFAAPLTAAAAALLLSLVVFQGPVGDRFTEEERELAENLELLENYEVLRALELVDSPAGSILEERR
jgi:hypothetical protein